MSNNIKELKALQPKMAPEQPSEIVQNPLANLSKTANKELYIVVAEDPTIKAKCRVYITSKTNASDAMVKFIGYEVTKKYSTVIAELKNTNIAYPDAIEVVKKYSEDLESLDLPWHRIIRVKTVKFAEK